LVRHSVETIAGPYGKDVLKKLSHAISQGHVALKARHGVPRRLLHLGGLAVRTEEHGITDTGFYSG
jgi:hypothetical protein